MLRAVIRIGVLLASCAIGLLIAKLILDGMHIEFGSFLIVVVLFTILQAILAPGCAKLMKRNSDALLSIAGLLSTLVALIVTTLISSGFTISGTMTWVWATLIVWAVTAAATFLLSKVVAKSKLGGGPEPTPAAPARKKG